MTRGPWKVVKTNIGRIVRSEERDVCMVYEGGFREQRGTLAEIEAEADANARLIATTPKLFAMVKDYAENADCGNGGEHTEEYGDKAANCWHCAAVALIAEAEGTTP